MGEKQAAVEAMSPAFHLTETTVHNAVQWLRLGVETIGAVIVGLGMLVAAYMFVRALWARKPANFNAIRLSFARYLALALEFQLGADILSTAVAPTPEQIIQLGAIAIIRTGLNYFLSREMKEESADERGEKKVVNEAESEGKLANPHPT